MSFFDEIVGAGCRATWTAFRDQNSVFGMKSENVSTAADCRTTCAGDVDCVAVDFNHNDHTCWMHYCARDLLDSNTYLLYNTTQYRLNRTCQQPTTGTFLITWTLLVCLCGSLAQCALSLKRLSAGPGFNPQTRQNKLSQDYWRSCFEINFSDRQEGLTVSSIICDS